MSPCGMEVMREWKSIKIRFDGWEDAQLVQRLLHRHRDPSSVHQNLVLTEYQPEPVVGGGPSTPGTEVWVLPCEFPFLSFPSSFPSL